MRQPSRIAIWRTAAVGAVSLVFAAVYDERVIVAFGLMPVICLMFVGVIRDLDARRDMAKWDKADFSSLRDN